VNAPVWPYLAIAGLAAGLAARVAVWYLAVADDPPRRVCPACDLPPSRPLVPVRPFTGRCLICGRAVAPVAMVPEALGAAGFALAGYVGGGWLRVAAVCWLLAFALPAVLVDAQVQFLPEVLTWPCLAGVVVLSLSQSAVSGSAGSAVRLVVVAVAVWGVFRVLQEVGFGPGDTVLVVSLAVVLADFSTTAVIAGIVGGVAIAGLLTLVKMAVGRRGPKDEVALGPALLSGMILALWLTAR